MRQLQVRILRPTGQKGIATGRVKTATGGYVDDDGLSPIPKSGDRDELLGSPFPCRYFHKPTSYKPSPRDQEVAGVATEVFHHVLSVVRPGADVRVGDIAILPAGTVQMDRSTEGIIVLTRSYPTGVQCDVETGAI